MKKRRLTLLAGCLALNAAALLLVLYARPGSATAPPVPAKAGEEAPPKIAASRITHVTVYPDSALVTREVDVPAGEGLMELVVTPLPEQAVSSSLYAESSEGTRVLTTRFRSRPVREDTREEVRRLQDEAKKLQQEAQKLQADVRALEANIMLLSKMENFTTASTVHATEKGKLDSEASIALAKYVMENRAEKTKALVALQHQQQENSEQQAFVARKLRDLSSGSSKTERDAVLVVEKNNAAAGKVRLAYLVNSASWRPQYKFRAGKTAKEAVSVEYLAAVLQQTGEDWSRVNLTLSTAQPMLNAAPPELQTLAVAVVPRGAPMPGTAITRGQLGLQIGGLGFGAIPTGPMRPGEPMPRPQPPAFANPGASGVTKADLDKAVKDLREQAQKEVNRRNEVLGAAVANYAAALEQARDLVVLTDGKQRGEGAARARRNEGPSVTYHLSSRLSVPSRPDDQVLEVCKMEMQPSYYYKAVPVLSPHVYRLATLVNKSKSVLLPGEATMYNGTDFVGRMQVPLVAVGEELTVGFGTEPQLQVQRQMLEKSKTMQGGNQILKFEYRILVSSYKTEQVKVQVWDRLPHAENEQMGVSLVKTAPDLCTDPVYLREERPNNLLRWDLEVGPDMRGERAKKIQYEFKLELDKQATIGSFQSR
jgi:hypothetical protein